MANARITVGTGGNTSGNFGPAPATHFQSLGESADKAADDMRRLFEASYEAKVERMVHEAERAGVTRSVITRIVSEVTRDSVREDLDEDATIGQMATALQKARDQVRHGVTYDEGGNTAEMDVHIFAERTRPVGADSWAEVLHSFVTRFDDHRALCERLDTARRGGRIVVKVEAVRGEESVVSSRAHRDEVAVSLLTGLPVRFTVEERAPRKRKGRRDRGDLAFGLGVGLDYRAG